MSLLENEKYFAFYIGSKKSEFIKDIETMIDYKYISTFKNILYNDFTDFANINTLYLIKFTNCNDVFKYTNHHAISYCLKLQNMDLFVYNNDVYYKNNVNNYVYKVHNSISNFIKQGDRLDKLKTLDNLNVEKYIRINNFDEKLQEKIKNKILNNFIGIYNPITNIIEKTSDFVLIETNELDNTHEYSNNDKILFSNNYLRSDDKQIKDNINFILAELISIPFLEVNKILRTHANANIHLDKNKRFVLLTDFIQNIDNVMNSNTFIPLLIKDENDLILLWKELMYEYKPYEFLQNHKLIIHGQTITVSYYDNMDLNHSIICNLNTRLHITNKKFNDITYKDALPYQTFFHENNAILNGINNTWVNMHIADIKDKIKKLKNLIKNTDMGLSEKYQHETKLAKYMNELYIYNKFQAVIDPYYNDHILSKTYLGIKCNFTNKLNGYTVLLYIRSFCMLPYKDKVLFMYEKTEYNNIFKLYLDKSLLKDVISLKIKSDLFSISRLFKMTTEDKYNIQNYNILDNGILLMQDSNLSLPYIKKLETFLDNNLNLPLICHQKGNLLWMLKLEDKIDEHKLVVSGFVGRISLNDTNINDMSVYINSLKKAVPETYLKNFVVKLDNKKYVTDISTDASIARVTSILTLLNVNNNSISPYYNNRYYNTNNYYDKNGNVIDYKESFNAIDNIYTYEDYYNKYQENIEFCGGVLCDEVGLGKTLSIISHLIVKFKNDMLKYSRYKARLNDLLAELTDNPEMEFVDPLDEGFEYNNLIIVPSRLTSQWASEIEKYCKDKFKLRVKVLVSVPSIKTLEKELKEFKYKLKSKPKPKKSVKVKSNIKKSKSKKDVTTTEVTFNNILNNTVVIEDTQDEYNYLNYYLDCNETGEDYYNDQLYDIYIVSINLLSNENYHSYILHNKDNHLKPFLSGIDSHDNYYDEKVKKILEYNDDELSKICRATDKFNIFKIKWNRIILDEAHEKLNPVIQLFTTSIKNYLEGNHKHNNRHDQFLYENLVILKSNYKWALTGTPAQGGIDNIMGILQFLTKKNLFVNYSSIIEKVRYFTNLIGITRENMDKIIKDLFRKTSKKDVKALLNIPLFTEEIIYVKQNNIERNIYNSIRCSRHFTEAVRLRRLFLMCTNILINEGYDFDGNNDIENEILTLEQLNANMISKFNIQLKHTIAKENELLNDNKISLNKIQLWQQLIEYNECITIPTEIFSIIENYFGTNKTNADIIYNLADMLNLYNDPINAGRIILENIDQIKQKIVKIWQTKWENINTCSRLSCYGASRAKIHLKTHIDSNENKLLNIAMEKKRINNQIALFSTNDFLKEKTSDPCIICFENLTNVVVTPCRHIFCLNCTKTLSDNFSNNFNCPECRSPITSKSLNVTTVDIINGINPQSNETPIVTEMIPDENDLVMKKLGVEWKNNCINKYGSKMAILVEYLYKLFDENTQNRVIIFSQYDKMLKMIGKTLLEYNIKFVYCQGNNYVVNKNINKFKKDDSIRVIMLSSESSNSGSNLTEANYIIFIDVLYQDQQHVKATEAQAIGRAVRLGQKLPVKVVRFITQGTIEEEHFTKNRYDMNLLQ